MKRFLKYFLPLVLLVGGSTYGIIRYLHLKDRGHATEEAADAIGNAASAVADWARDKTPRRVDVVAFFGEWPVHGHAGLFAVRARLTAVGAAHMSDLCASMPVVRDAINTVLFDRVHRALDARRGLDDATLARFQPRLRAEINRSLRTDVVSDVRLSRTSPAALNDSGCKTGRTVSRR